MYQFMFDPDGNSVHDCGCMYFIWAGCPAHFTDAGISSGWDNHWSFWSGFML